jgi:hypothetical protein
VDGQDDTKLTADDSGGILTGWYVYAVNSFGCDGMSSRSKPITWNTRGPYHPAQLEFGYKIILYTFNILSRSRRKVRIDMLIWHPMSIMIDKRSRRCQ